MEANEKARSGTTTRNPTGESELRPAARPQYLLQVLRGRVPRARCSSKKAHNRLSRAPASPAGGRGDRGNAGRGSVARARCRARASSPPPPSGSRSLLLITSQRGFAASSLLNFFSSATIARASFTGSASGSRGAMSTRCSSTRVRCRCFRKRIPRPAPSAAPSISPGMSAMTKLRCSPTSTTPRFG